MAKHRRRAPATPPDFDMEQHEAESMAVEAFRSTAEFKRATKIARKAIKQGKAAVKKAIKKQIR